MTCSLCPRTTTHGVAVCPDCISDLLRRDRRDAEPAVTNAAAKAQHPGSAPDPGPSMAGGGQRAELHPTELDGAVLPPAFAVPGSRIVQPDRVAV